MRFMKYLLIKILSNKNPNDSFSYYEIGVINRWYISSALNLNPNVIENDDDINGKNILILDDTATTGKTFSDSTLALMDLYAPAKISLFAIFSPVENHIIKKQVK